MRDLDLAHLLTHADRLLSAHVATLLEPENCTLDEWRVLKVLADGHGHIVAEIADYAMLPGPALTKLMERMAFDGLVYRRVDPRDRHRVLNPAKCRRNRGLSGDFCRHFGVSP